MLSQLSYAPTRTNDYTASGQNSLYDMFVQTSEPDKRLIMGSPPMPAAMMVGSYGVFGCMIFRLMHLDASQPATFVGFPWDLPFGMVLGALMFWAGVSGHSKHSAFSRKDVRSFVTILIVASALYMAIVSIGIFRHETVGQSGGRLLHVISVTMTVHGIANIFLQAWRNRKSTESLRTTNG